MTDQQLTRDQVAEMLRLLDARVLSHETIEAATALARDWLAKEDELQEWKTQYAQACAANQRADLELRRKDEEIASLKGDLRYRDNLLKAATGE